jgi:predicted Rossmann fold nucleotide-binding protein DprA/Smf involved in DNA uptake
MTVAVIGSGIDVCYPKEHRPLAREIVKAGCVFTEYPPGSRPDGHNFPVRNRIISGLSKVTLVIEGKERSGALLTARHAKEQGRTVYAVPGNVGNPNSEVCNLLLKNGARVCTCADDIVRDFEMSSLGKLNPFELAKKAPVNMQEVLSMLKIACVTQDDPIFKTPRSRASTNKAQEPSPAVVEQAAPPVQTPDFSGFDAKALKIYKKIPLGEECTIESLADSELNMRDVMKGLLKLEMGKFITVLPGEKVRRN